MTDSRVTELPQSSGGKTSYQLAYPAAYARHKRLLRLRRKLLFQLQQTSSTRRPLPILDVYFPSIAYRLPSRLGRRGRLGPNDLIIANHLPQHDLDTPDEHGRSDETAEKHQEVARIHQSLDEGTAEKGKAEICLDNGMTWEAIHLPNGSYEFVADTSNGRQIMRWVLSGCQSPGETSTAPGDTKRFKLNMIDPDTCRHPDVASMARNHLEVWDKYTGPFASSDSLTPDAASQTEQVLKGSIFASKDELRALVMVTSIWVAFREGWSYGSGYNAVSVTSVEANNV